MRIVSAECGNRQAGKGIWPSGGWWR